MVRYWTNFARTGNPNAHHATNATTDPFLPNWPAYGSSSPLGTSLNLDVDNISSVPGLLEKQCAFWRSYVNPADPY